MKDNSTKVTAGILFVFAGICAGVSSTEMPEGFDGLNKHLQEYGIEAGLGVTSIYQANTKGGVSTHNRKGRHTGSYDVEISADLQKLLGLDNGVLFLHLEGGWPDTEGVDVCSVANTLRVNGDAVGNNAVVVKQLFYEGYILDESLLMTAGKIDFTGVFDKNAYADDETSQFLNAAFVDDPTIPFPQYSLGAVLTVSPTENWYVMAGVADAQADCREAGFRTTFHKEDYFFYAVETGITSEIVSDRGTMPGTYRAGLWNDPQPKANSDRTDNSRDDFGLYTSCDQMLFKENSNPCDCQGLGCFFRYGYAPSKRNDIANFVSFGLQYQGLVEDRDEDVLGLAFARGYFSDSADITYTDDYENAVEVYYNVKLNDNFNISPGVQYITNPGGNSAVADAVVVGIRAQISF